MTGDVGAPLAASLSRFGNELRLEVVERNGDDFVLEARVRVRHFHAAAACNVPLEDLLAWRARLAELHETSTGQAELQRQGFRLVLAANRGRVDVQGEFDSESGWGNGERAVLRFWLPPVDRTDVEGLLEMVDAATRMPPTVHDEERSADTEPRT